MNLVTNLVPLDVLTATIRELEFGENELQAYLPNVMVEDVDYRFAEVSRSNRAARIRAYDAPPEVGKRPGVTERRGGLPPISEIYPLTESERVRLRRMRGGALDVIRRSVYTDSALGTSAIANRVEMLRGEALSTGEVVIDEGGVTVTIDFGVPSGSKKTAATAWTTVTGNDILTEELGWLAAYRLAAGGAPGEAVTSFQALSLMLRNAAVREQLSVGGTVPSIVTPSQLNDFRRSHGLPPIRVYDRQVEDADGNLQRVIAENKLVYLPGSGETDPSRRVGETQWGVTEESAELAERQIIDADDAPGVVAVTLKDDLTSTTYTKVSGIALPVIKQPRKILTATLWPAA
ncbi:major capsid protein [Euzebya rosea]|uniref:major capsid protein n=1 Tax=Euzebya rosea TaxID=2052804 RepID=UPI000D3E16FF|nr:major capsid protein [Euzebya rosea]